MKLSTIVLFFTASAVLVMDVACGTSSPAKENDSIKVHDNYLLRHQQQNNLEGPTGETVAAGSEVKADFTKDNPSPKPSTSWPTGRLTIHPTAHPTRSPTSSCSGFFYVSVSTTEPVSIRLHDANMVAIASFPTIQTPGEIDFPNGVATDGTLIYYISTGPRTVFVTDYTGMLVRSFSYGATGGSGMDLVNNALGVITTAASPDGFSTEVSYINPTTGDFLRAVTYLQSSGGGGSDAMAFDGTTLWLLNANIDGYDPNGGNRTRVLINPATGCPFQGTGMGWEQATNSLIIGCRNGDWCRVSTQSGLVTATGNNGQSMFGLKATNC
jgi:hypothetical protein